MHPARFFFFGVCFCAIWFSLLQQNKRRDMFNLSMCFCYAGCCVFSFFSSSFISVCVWVCVPGLALATMKCACLARIKCWTNQNEKFINIQMCVFLLLSSFPPSALLAHSFIRSADHFHFFCCCANDWLWVNAACWVWFDGSLLVVSSFI